MAKLPPPKDITRKRLVKVIMLRTLGNFLILFTIFGIVMTIGPAAYYEISYRLVRLSGQEFVIQEQVNQADERNLEEILAIQTELARQRQDDPDPGLFEALLDGEEKQIIIPKSAQFSVVIPKIGANREVTENVDPSNRDEYLTALKTSVAHAKGSSLPGLGGTTYLFAHSANSFWEGGSNNAIFYLLKDLSPGDDIVVFFQNRRYNYVMTNSEIVDSDQVEFITSDRGEGEELILQTCWPPGTSWKRLLIFTEPKVQ